MWLAPSGPPQEFNYTNIGIREIGIRWNFPQFPNGIITDFTVSTATLDVIILFYNELYTFLTGVL